MERKIYGIFTAGGSGTRMGASLPKQFLEIGGKPILRLTIERFLQALPGLEVITVLPHEWMPYWKDLCLGSAFDCPQRLVEGGLTRFHSVKNALAAVPDGAFVLVQDGVRPFLSVGKIREMMAAMQAGAHAVIPVVPVTDTLHLLCRNGDGQLEAMEGTLPERNRLFGAQTPQIFRSEELRGAYSQAYDTAFTDDASVARAAGIPLTYIEGERYNIKITTPEDLTMARSLLQL
ncbi:MAG: 2-C-methyl-D-erythritol 4-phosphate cytidylyltransferase [Bacteroidales bacterium]|nr:2-C-methyl-D-erythritol 4-phosphate cytidylyltransferase [Bacteroidales bacterium]